MINLGATEWSQILEDDPRIERVRAAKIELHPDYNFTEPYRYHGNDLAVVRLERKVEVKDTVVPACFPLSQQEDQILSRPGQSFWTAGLGAIGASRTSPGGKIASDGVNISQYEGRREERHNWWMVLTKLVLVRPCQSLHYYVDFQQRNYTFR